MKFYGSFLIKQMNNAITYGNGTSWKLKFELRTVAGRKMKDVFNTNHFKNLFYNQ